MVALVVRVQQNAAGASTAAISAWRHWLLHLRPLWLLPRPLGQGVPLSIE